MLIMNEDNAADLTDVYYNGALTNGVIDPISDETIDSDLNAFIDEKCKKYLRDKGIDW